MDNLKDPLYRNSLAIMLNSAIGAFFGLLFWIMAARSMPSGEIGLATALISATELILVLSRLGLDQGLVRFLPGSENKSGLYSTFLISTILCSFIITVPLMALGWIYASLLGPALSSTSSYPLLFSITGQISSVLSDHISYRTILLLFVYILLATAEFMQCVAFAAIRRADLSIVQNLLLGMRIPAIIILAPILAPSGVDGVLISLVIAYMLAFVVAAILLHKHGLPMTANFDVYTLKKVSSFSLANYSAGIFSILPAALLPMMIVSVTGAKESAYFYIACSIATLLSVIPTAVSTSLFVEGSHELPLRKNVINAGKFTLLLMIPALILIFLAGDRLLMLFGKEYTEQTFMLLRTLALSSLFYTVTSIYITIKKVQKKVAAVNYVNIALSFLILASAYPALRTWGLPGAGYAWLGAHILLSVILLGVMVFKEHWIRW